MAVMTTVLPARPDFRDDLPCKGRGALFDVRGDQGAEQQAKSLCSGCPMLLACRDWAVMTAVDGVCGGMTEVEREQWRHERILTDDLGPEVAYRLYLLNPQDGLARQRLVIPMVRVLIEQGLRDSEIAEKMEVTIRSVQRYRVTIRHQAEAAALRAAG